MRLEDSQKRSGGRPRSFLAALPTEVLLLIVGLLPQVSVQALRVTCRRRHRVVGETTGMRQLRTVVAWSRGVKNFHMDGLHRTYMCQGECRGGC